MMSSTMVNDGVIIISSHVVGFVYYNNKVGSGENIVLRREPLCQYDKWEISFMSMVARTHSVVLGLILDFILINESGVTSAYITGKGDVTPIRGDKEITFHPWVADKNDVIVESFYLVGSDAVTVNPGGTERMMYNWSQKGQDIA
eukprot:6351889-Ditylum_brightwellii.AAC.1